MIKLDADLAIQILIAAAQGWGDKGVPMHTARDGKSIAYQVDACYGRCEYEWIEAVTQDDGSTIFYGSK